MRKDSRQVEPGGDDDPQPAAAVTSALDDVAASRAQTELRARAAGTIVAVAGHVGETPGAGGSSSSGASSGGGGAFITMIAS
jgi:hypothetical protein